MVREPRFRPRTTKLEVQTSLRRNHGIFISLLQETLRQYIENIDGDVNSVLQQDNDAPPHYCSYNTMVSRPGDPGYAVASK